MARKNTKSTPKSAVSREEDFGETVQINPEKLISVMSLCNWKLTLTRDEKGTRPYWEFDGFGKIKLIPYSSLLQIMEAHPTFLEGGVYYIQDRDVIKKHGLQPLYENILDKATIEKVLSGVDVDVALDLYRNASEHQKDIIKSLILERIRKGELRDLGIIYKFSEIAGEDLNKIVERQKELREIWKADNIEVK